MYYSDYNMTVICNRARQCIHTFCWHKTEHILDTSCNGWCHRSIEENNNEAHCITVIKYEI